MGIARSTYYDRPERPAEDTAIVEAMFTLRDEFEAYGYRRVGACPAAAGLVVNHKKVRRLMREHDLQPKVRRRFIATTDSDHDGPIFPNLAKDIVPSGPNQLWVSDITYVALPARFIYVAIILDAWSRLIVGYAIGRSIDARLTVAALKAVMERRKPPPGAVHHFRSRLVRCRALSRDTGGQRPARFDGTPRQSPRQRQGRSFMKTLKVEAVYPMAFENVRGHHRAPSPLHRGGLQQTPAPFSARLFEPATVRGSTHPADWQISSLIPCPPQAAHSNKG